MKAATWPTVRRAFPGPTALAVWILATVPAPLVSFEATHRWEEDQKLSTALWWTVLALPVLAAVVAAKWTAGTGRRRTVAALVTTVLVATLVSAVFLGASLAFHRWVVPLDGVADWPGVLARGATLTVCGAVLGHLGGLGVRRPAYRPGYLVGGAVALVGALFGQLTVELGAEGSTRWYDVGDYGPYVASTGQPGRLTLPAAGRYAIYAVGFAPQNPDCRISGPTAESAQRVTIPPGEYGGDAASYTWVAYFDVPAPGPYSLTCRSYGQEASYGVGDVPRIHGAVGALIHWPLGVIWLFGAAPGLLMIADSLRRRAHRRSAPDRPAGDRTGCGSAR